MPNVTLPIITLAFLVGAGATAHANVSLGALMNHFTGSKRCLTPVGKDQVNMMPCTNAPKQTWDLAGC